MEGGGGTSWGEGQVGVRRQGGGGEWEGWGVEGREGGGKGEREREVVLCTHTLPSPALKPSNPSDLVFQRGSYGHHLIPATHHTRSRAIYHNINCYSHTNSRAPCCQDPSDPSDVVFLHGSNAHRYHVFRMHLPPPSLTCFWRSGSLRPLGPGVPAWQQCSLLAVVCIPAHHTDAALQQPHRHQVSVSLCYMCYVCNEEGLVIVRVHCSFAFKGEWVL